MFGLTFEKIIIIGVIAAVIIGPQRLPGYARRLADLVRSFRSFVDVLKTRTEAEIGVPLNTTEWNAKLREYDPRTIVKHALNDDPLPTPPPKPSEEEPEMVERWEIVGGSSGHPIRRKVWVPVEKQSEKPTVQPVETTEQGKDSDADDEATTAMAAVGSETPQ